MIIKEVERKYNQEQLLRYRLVRNLCLNIILSKDISIPLTYFLQPFNTGSYK